MGETSRLPSFFSGSPPPEPEPELWSSLPLPFSSKRSKTSQNQDSALEVTSALLPAITAHARYTIPQYVPESLHWIALLLPGGVPALRPPTQRRLNLIPRTGYPAVDLKSTYCFCAHMHEIIKYFLLTENQFHPPLNRAL